MSDIDYLRLDARMLHQFLTVYDSGSVTGAALRLGIGQSAVSHTLDRLRDIVGDPLFVRQGRGITPTQKAHDLAQKLRLLLPQLQALTQPAVFAPSDMTGQITIAADDFERELLAPALTKAIWAKAPDASLRFLSPGTATAGMLRRNVCDLMVSPTRPDGVEFIQKRLFADDWSVFYAPGGAAPRTLEDYCARPHAKVVFGDDDSSMIDHQLAQQGVARKVHLRVDSFLALPTLMRNSDLIVTLPKMAAKTFMAGFSHCSAPIPLVPLPFYLLWHHSQTRSPRSTWLRQQVQGTVQTLLAQEA